MLTLVAVGALPLLIADPAPLQDWPNHLARVRVEDALLRDDPFWSRFYALNGFLVPNAALDLVLLGLARLGIGAAAAGVLFLTATYSIFVTGFSLLARAMGAGGRSKPVLASLLFYSGVLFWGLLNYALGVAVLMILLAFWLNASEQSWRRWAIAAIGTALLFVCHLVAAAAFVYVLFCLEIVALARDPAAWRLRLPRHASPLAALAILVIARHLAPQDGPLLMDYAGPPSLLGFIGWKIGIFARMAFGGSARFDWLSAGAALGALTIMIVTRARLGNQGTVIVIAFALLALVAPEALGTGSLLDERLALLPVLAMAACARIEWRLGRARDAAFAGLGMLLIVRTAVLALDWREADRTYAAFDAAAAALPPGSILKLAFGRPLNQVSRAVAWRPPIAHLDTIAVRYGIFVPGVFASRSQQPIALRAPYLGLTQPVDLTSPEAARIALAPLGPLCAEPFNGFYLLVLFQAPLDRRGWLNVAAREDNVSFQLLDACRLMQSIA